MKKKKMTQTSSASVLVKGAESTSLAIKVQLLQNFPEFPWLAFFLLVRNSKLSVKCKMQNV